MSSSIKLAGFALVLAVLFGAGFGVGTAAGPLGDDDQPATEQHQMPQTDMSQMDMSP